MSRRLQPRSKIISRRSKASATSTRLFSEPLESRNMLATFLVTTPLDGTLGDLRSAIAAANQSPGSDIVQFNVPSVALTLGEIAITDSVQLEGSTAGHVDILATPGARIFNVDDAAPGQVAVTMNELTLRGGSAPIGGAILNHEHLELRNSTLTGNDAELGGAIFNDHGSVTMQNVNVYDNIARYEGGGAMNVGGLLDVRDSEIRINRAVNPNGQSTFGGGIRNLGLALSVLDNSRVLGNAAYASGAGRAYGGGIATHLESTVHLVGSDVGENYATHEGGGLFLVDNSVLISEAHPIHGNHSNIFGNIAGEAGGGVYLLRSQGHLTDTTITGNITELRGGGISAGNDVTLDMFGVEVSNNTTNFFSADGSGGGLYLSGFGQANGPMTTIHDSRIERNNVDPNGSAGGEFGGGISARYGTTLTLVNTTVLENKASISGGGLYASDRFTPHAPVLTISDSTIALNSSGSLGGGITAAGGLLDVANSDVDGNITGDRGGGLLLTGLGSPSALHVEIRDSTISGNHAILEGGGIAAGPNMTMILERANIDANRTYGKGGGLYLTALGLGIAPHSTSIADSNILNNTAQYDPAGPPYSYASGGGIWAAASADLLVETTTVAGNNADRYGGGIMFNEALATVSNSTVHDNATGVRGGGAYVKNSNVSFEQNTWTANRANGDGGAIAVHSFLNNAVTITSNTISLNQADRDQNAVGSGGGIFVDDDPANNVQLLMDHSIVARNFAGSQLALPHNDDIHDGPGLAGTSPLDSRYSLIGSRKGTVLAAANPDPNGNIVGVALSPVDPLLGPLANNGGMTDTMLPQPGSPAINRGDPTFTGVFGFDQRGIGFQRVVSQIDLGSVEVQSSLPGPDFNHDGSIDGVDINLLTQSIANATYVNAYDMNADGVLDMTDIERWLCKAGHVNLGANLSYRFADANLDGVVDGQDFIVWNLNKFSANADWTAGDFNADGVVDGLDFIVWNANKFLGAFVCNPVPVLQPGNPSGHLTELEDPVAAISMNVGQRARSAFTAVESMPASLHATRLNVALPSVTATEVRHTQITRRPMAASASWLDSMWADHSTWWN